MKIGEKILYYNGMCGDPDKTDKLNEKFWDMLQHITTGGVCIESRWSGDYYVRTYEMFRVGTYEIWENMEYGIPHSIERIA